jgi:pSer/pThr/pTyr-binding forkhead associated (FHA) protein
MPKLILQFDGRVLKECVVGSAVTIGRLPDNTLVIENPAVSGHHARVVRQGDECVLEDLESTNGTYVNDRHVTRHVLKHGDAVLIGKHTLLFEHLVVQPAAPPKITDSSLSIKGDTVYLDTQKHREMLATLRPKPAPAPGVPPKVGVLRVLDGPTAKSEYRLEGRTSLIGASDEALVKLQGWFKPKVALAIARNGVGYTATHLGGKALVNNQPVAGRHELKDGDVLQVSGMTLEFRLEG